MCFQSLAGNFATGSAGNISMTLQKQQRHLHKSYLNISDPVVTINTAAKKEKINKSSDGVDEGMTDQPTDQQPDVRVHTSSVDEHKII